MTQITTSAGNLLNGTRSSVLLFTVVYVRTTKGEMWERRQRETDELEDIQHE